jgi:hypothetical protein
MYPPSPRVSSCGPSLPAELRMPSAGLLNTMCRPLPVRLVAVCGSSPNRANAFSPSGPSTSTTTMPDTSPVAMPMLALGRSVHQAVIWSALVVASLSPCVVIGILSPGRSGNTAQPSSVAYQSAARPRSESVNGLLASSHPAPIQVVELVLLSSPGAIQGARLGRLRRVGSTTYFL